MGKEHVIQSNCVVLFRNNVTRHGNGLMVEIENKTDSAQHGKKRKAMGMIPGFPDTMLIFGGKIVFVEFKVPNGRQSPDQKIIEKILTNLGFAYYICRSELEFVNIVFLEGGEIIQL